MFLYVLGLVPLWFAYRWYKESKRVPNREDKYVYITGCDTGFGNQLARHLDKLGYRVIAGCYTEKGEDELKKNSSDRLASVHLDVSNSESVRKAATFIQTLVGQKGLWAVVNNAGVATPSAATDWLTIEDYKAMLAVNLFGVIDVTLSVLPLIKKTRGRVVNVASVFGRISPFGGPYCVSKYGVESFSDSLRLNMAPFGIKVACIEPGFFKTNVTDTESTKNCLRKLWERLPQDVKDDYGADFLEPSLQKLDNRFKLLTDTDLMKVVGCMEHAISAVHPRIRYSAGWDAKFIWLPLSYMPTFISDRLFLQDAPKPKVSILYFSTQVSTDNLTTYLLEKDMCIIFGSKWFILGFSEVRAVACVFQVILAHPALACVLLLLTLAAVRWHIRDSYKLDGFDQKHVFITGCDSGFGNLLARQLDGRGFQVTAACLTEKGAADLAAAASPRLKTLLLNVTDSASIRRAVEFVSKEVGERGLWGLVNNAGRSVPIGPVEWMQLEDFTKVLDVNLIGVIEVTLQFLPLLKKAQGRVVNVSSILGRLSLTGGGYCLSKWGVETFSDSLRRDMQHFGVKVSIIEPGFFKTAVTRLDLINADLKRLWSRLPQDVKDSYGATYFNNYVKGQEFSMGILCSPDISKVTSCMEHALTARFPRTRYSAGWDAKLLWIPLSYLPSFVSDFVVSVLLPSPKQERKI
ncbi:hypothetical protein L3Q82_017468 [Scortum barcoo]|uniref:Uncharacterized protein n=1 Tax=Scortum barcoo TaxID=214431 RepID=A0ACB8VL35_9TELE|nr:hypothetical protein L3Q82_017468 [Scortum barcoo]